MEPKDKVFSIQLKGGLDGTSADDFYRYFESQVGKGYRKFLFQFGALDFITSNGISVIVKIHKQITKIGAVYAIYGVKQEVEDVLTLVGLFDKLPIFRDHNQAESFLLKMEPKRTNPPETKSTTESAPQTPVGGENRIRFYFTGKSKENDASTHGIEPVSRLESIPEAEIQEPVTPPNPSSSPMELVLEEKLNSLKREIKETLNHELERRFAVYKTPSGTEEKRITIPSYIQSKTKQLETIERIIQCEVCGTRLRLHKFGKHECPGCSTQFEMSTSGSVRFLEKLNPI
ncbi:STAS domain-containing protein [Leptospira sp. 2 VSF19]|uniref:STAS domain-containing protein n=1 Tax=Leptospira soteropolitanensis TaxID=2950025 RepID=A0AAW5VR39_9LEPT|nr:STAS domain-containing protein [Leptospira soteropolitanensis]MCW7493779.1 STAS domain-containing protein [Leptospira soteropolitanensis]MCW7501377.1 STAS domain-containing protein [Leptospira soteropolitanensis]MCW7523437.1 STAS domain-containing protein [Leptospira soteropolitanensis]MCW7527491.1 STAS domain-containing protein [Leptospira soteropolitanensis]MCW7531347.1 STAS domain-containing protein [Leptospira soteropolitanensis]